MSLKTSVETFWPIFCLDFLWSCSHVGKSLIQMSNNNHSWIVLRVLSVWIRTRGVKENANMFDPNSSSVWCPYMCFRIHTVCNAWCDTEFFCKTVGLNLFECFSDEKDYLLSHPGYPVSVFTCSSKWKYPLRWKLLTWTSLWWIKTRALGPRPTG